MDQLRPLSARPQVLVDNQGRCIGDPHDMSRVGLDAPFGRERVLFALAIDGAGPMWLTAPIVLKDADGSLIAAPDLGVVGKAGTLVSRILDARWVEDTRRLSG